MIHDGICFYYCYCYCYYYCYYYYYYYYYYNKESFLKAPDLTSPDLGIFA